MIEKDLDAVFDVHRDAAPWNEYFQEIDEEPIAQVLIVVGTQNPAYRANEEFAWQLKAVGDEMTPNLVKGIFYASGDYNQDLHPRSLLLEMGGSSEQKRTRRTRCSIVCTGHSGNPLRRCIFCSTTKRKYRR